MAKRYHRKTYRRAEGYGASFFRMLPALLAVGVVPLIVRQTTYATELSEQPWFGNATAGYEFFLAPKALLLTLLLLVMAVAAGARIRKEKKSVFAKLFLPLLAYETLAFLSACFSVNRNMSFGGGYEQFESIWVLLSYGMIVYYIFLYAQTETELLVVTDAICFGSTVIGLLGTLQGFGFDYLATELGQKLVTTEAYLNSIGGRLTLQFEDTKHAYATLYNPNYLGMYGAFLLPFLVLLILFEKTLWRRIWHCVNFVLMAAALLFSQSRAGLIAAGIAVCVALLLNLRNVLKWWYLLIPAANFAVVLLLLVNAYRDNLLLERLQNMFQKEDTTVTEYVAEDGTLVRETGLTEMITATEGVILTYNGLRFQVSLYVEGNAYGIYATTETGEQLLMTADETGSLFQFEASALEKVSVKPMYVGEELGICITVEGKEWVFCYDDTKSSYQYVTRYGKLSDMITGESFGFENSQKIFSGRGYIWSRTLPLLKKHIFLGSGPDTFLLEFPQKDYLKMYQMGEESLIMTRPHNMYLQIGVQTGVLSLLCFLVFYGWYAVSALRLYAFRRITTQAEGFGNAAFIGSIGYMLAGITNDSMVVTAPVFWGMVGLGIAANAIVAKQRKGNAAEAVKNAVVKPTEK